MADRFIVSNLVDDMVPNNKICTSKYTAITFLPKNLFEQFSKVANIYFVVSINFFSIILKHEINIYLIYNLQIIGILNIIPSISNTGGKPIIYIPLFIIIMISMLKDVFEDGKRHKSDNEENNRDVLVFEHEGFVKKK